MTAQARQLLTSLDHSRTGEPTVESLFRHDDRQYGRAAFELRDLGLVQLVTEAGTNTISIIVITPQGSVTAKAL